MPTSDSVPSPAQESSLRLSLHNYLVLLLGSSTSDDIPIALWKGKYNCTQHSLFNFVSYSHLSSAFHSFISFLDSCSVLKNVSEAMSLPGWSQTMQEEMTALEQNETRELVTLPSRKKVVGCKWAMIHGCG